MAKAVWDLNQSLSSLRLEAKSDWLKDWNTIKT